MRRFPTTLLILAVAVLGIAIGVRLFWPSESSRYRAVEAVRGQASVIRLSETIVYAKGAIASETLRLLDDNGRSSAHYEIADRKGNVARFDEPIPGYDVSFAFDVLVRDGIWQLPTPQHFHGNTDTIYSVGIEQTAGARSGAHHFSFADPHWLATAAGHQFTIRLDPHGRTPTRADLLRLQATSSAEPRYQKIVEDFRRFGPPRFRRTMEEARRKLLAARS